MTDIEIQTTIQKFQIFLGQGLNLIRNPDTREEGRAKIRIALGIIRELENL